MDTEKENSKEANACLPRFVSSPWGERHGEVLIFDLPKKFGNGQSVALSFFAAPECIIGVTVDEGLPLDLNLQERFKHSEEIRSFRDLLPAISDECRSEWGEPPGLTEYRKNELDECEEDLWESVFEDGATWTFLANGMDEGPLTKPKKK